MVILFLEFTSTNFTYSFIVFLPEWKSISKLEESMYKRRSMVVLGMAHEYRHGYQHMLQK